MSPAVSYSPRLALPAWTWDNVTVHGGRGKRGTFVFATSSDMAADLWIVKLR